MGNRPMGVGRLGSPDVIFVRKFRWTLQGRDDASGDKTLDEHFFKKVAIDFTRSRLDFCVYEVVDKDIEDIF